MSRVAVVTGASKGIGFALVKALCKRFNGIVYLTSRDEIRGRDAVKELNQLGLFPEYHQLDVTDRESIIKLRDHLLKEHGGFDILVNNAAMIHDFNGTTDVVNENKIIIETNYYSLLSIRELLVPYIRCNGRILNMSSDCGHISNIANKYWINRLTSPKLTIDDINEFVNWFLESFANGKISSEDICEAEYIAAYIVSKVALSALTIVQKRELQLNNIIVNCVHPGFVQTDMTLGAGTLTPDEATDTLIYLLLDAPSSIRGAFVWSDRTVVEWSDCNAL